MLFRWVTKKKTNKHKKKKTKLKLTWKLCTWLGGHFAWINSWRVIIRWANSPGQIICLAHRRILPLHWKSSRFLKQHQGHSLVLMKTLHLVQPFRHCYNAKVLSSLKLATKYNYIRRAPPSQSKLYFLIQKHPPWAWKRKSTNITWISQKNITCMLMKIKMHFWHIVLHLENIADEKKTTFQLQSFTQKKNNNRKVKP